MTMDELPVNVPSVAKIINQLTSSQAIRAFMVVLFSLITVILLVSGREIPDLVTGVLFAVLGYYFGESAPSPRQHE